MTQPSSLPNDDEKSDADLLNELRKLKAPGAPALADRIARRLKKLRLRLIQATARAPRTVH